MKAILLLTFLALVSCAEVELQTAAPVDVVKCVLRSDVLFKSIEKVISAIQTKDMGTIAMTVLSLYPGVVDEIKKCLADGEPNLQIADWVITLVKLLGPIVWDLVKEYAFPYLKQLCKEKFGDTWYCNAIPA